MKPPMDAEKCEINPLYCFGILSAFIGVNLRLILVSGC